MSVSIESALTDSASVQSDRESGSEQFPFITAVQVAFEVDLPNQIPASCQSWSEKTSELIRDKYQSASPLTQRSVHVLTNLGNSYPGCKTLETLTRSVLRTDDVNPDSILKILKRFQEQARQNGNDAIMSGSLMFAFTPLFLDGKMTGHESDLLKLVVGILPPVIYASVGSGSGGKKGESSAGKSSMTTNEHAHMTSMNAAHGVDKTGRNWLTQGRAKEVYGSYHPAGTKKK
jgi:hypothetical protein